MRRRVLVLPPALALAAVPVLLFSPGTNEARLVTTTPKTVPAKPTVVKRRVYRRGRVVSRARFRPDARPSPRRVHRIIALEAARWGASEGRLSCRIRGESGYRWWAANGPYQGLGQFHSETFYRGLSSIGTRRVRIIVRRVRRPRSVVKTIYSDGSRTRTRGQRYRQVRYRVYSGAISANADRLHGWAHVRIMARSLVGLGNVNDSEWEVRCG